MSSASSPHVITPCHSARILYGSVRWFGQVIPSISLRQHTSGLICYSDAVIAAVAVSMQEIMLLYKSMSRFTFRRSIQVELGRVSESVLCWYSKCWPRI